MTLILILFLVFIIALIAETILEVVIKKENKRKFKHKLKSEEFYNIMQNYRHASYENQEYVTEKFEEVKEWIRVNLL